MSSIAEAHAALLRNAGLQFDLPAGAEARTEPATPREPWHLSFGTGGAGLVWILVGVAVIAILLMTLTYVRQRPAAGRAPVPDPTPDVVIAQGPARAALGDADRLAGEGRYLDAAHALLACGVDALGERHPGLLRPATTSRDIARAEILSEPLRLAFGRIAASVEVGLFGGRPVGPDDYATCRRIFVDSALAGTA